MKFLLITVAVLAATQSAYAAQPAPSTPLAPAKPTLTVTAEGIGRDGYIEPEFAYCIAAADGKSKDGPDKSVGLAWTKGPAGTKAYAIIASDADVPTVFDDAGKEGKTLSATMPRRKFYHWVLYDIPGDKLMIPAYTDSQALVQHGKSVLKTPYGTRGVNDYAPFMAASPEHKGIYAGYDGPCPPWNDERIHQYTFKVYAVDSASLGLSGPVTGKEVEAALSQHILASGEVVGKYTLNPSVKK